MTKRFALLATLAVGSLAACAPAGTIEMGSNATMADTSPTNGTTTDAQFEAQVVQGLRGSIMTDIVNMETALKALQAAAPAPADRGWDCVEDAAALDAMRASWVAARQAYERVEGVLAPVFPGLDKSLDERYDGFLAGMAGVGDQYFFDDRGVTGMHAMERILYVDTTPAGVLTAESVIPGYKAAAMPATAQEAADFKTKLCGKALADAAVFKREWASAAFDASFAFAGLVDLMIEQREKVNKAASNEEESRYSQRTMDDLRENLVGTKRAYEIFVGWITSKPSGRDIHNQIEAGLTRMDDAYTGVSGTSIPQPPDSWSDDPSPADLASPFGKLYTLVRASVNPNLPGSVVGGMDAASSLLGFPQE